MASFTITGHGNVPRSETSWGHVNASWPLVRLAVSDDEQEIEVRVRLVVTAARWTCRTRNLERVEATATSVVLYPRHARACRFGTIDRTALAPLFEVLHRQSVRVVPVSSTWRFAWQRRRR